MYSKIVNPMTGRKVSLEGKLGKQILYNYINELTGGAKTPKLAKACVYEDKYLATALFSFQIKLLNHGPKPNHNMYKS